MKKIIKYLLLVINIIILYYLLIYNNWLVYDMTYTKTLFFIISTCLYIFIMGIVLNEEKEYKRNIYCYIIMFLILLFSFTFIIGRPNIMFYKNSHMYMQLKPFYTIYNILKRGTMNSILKNILGNIIALIPLSFLLMIKDKKYNNILRQLLIIIPIIIFIELFQSYSHTGSLDIDDIILNCLGPIIFTFLITRFNLIEKIRKMFYTDFSVKKKEMLFYISTIIIIIVDIMMFII